jgi:nicotinamidase-related amidase
VARQEEQQMMDTDRLEPQRTCVLVFDMLNGYVHRSEETRAYFQPILAIQGRVVDAARREGAMVAYAAANHRADGGTTRVTRTDTGYDLKPWPPGEGPSKIMHITGGSWEAQVVDELAPRPEDYVIPKFRWSTFHQTYFDLALRTRDVDTLVLMGGSTDVGIASTAYSGRDLDYNLVFVRDACFANPPENNDHFMDKVFPRMGRIRTSDQVVAMLSGG